MEETVYRNYTIRIRNELCRIYDQSSIEEDDHIIGQKKANLLVWLFFEYFVVFEEEITHLLKIKEFFYLYIFTANIRRFEIYKKENLEQYRDENYIQCLARKLRFCLRICDFQELSSIAKVFSRELESNPTYTNAYKGANREFAVIFENLSTFFENYARILENNEEDMSQEDLYKIEKNIKNLK